MPIFNFILYECNRKKKLYSTWFQTKLQATGRELHWSWTWDSLLTFTIFVFLQTDNSLQWSMDPSVNVYLRWSFSRRFVVPCLSRCSTGNRATDHSSMNALTDGDGTASDCRPIVRRLNAITFRWQCGIKSRDTSVYGLLIREKASCTTQ